MTDAELEKLTKDVLADGKVDFDETTKLLGFMTPFSLMPSSRRSTPSSSGFWTGCKTFNEAMWRAGSHSMSFSQTSDGDSGEMSASFVVVCEGGDLEWDDEAAMLMLLPYGSRVAGRDVHRRRFDAQRHGSSLSLIEGLERR